MNRSLMTRVTPWAAQLLLVLFAFSCNAVTPQTNGESAAWAPQEPAAEAQAPTQTAPESVPADDITPPPDEIPALGTKASFTDEELRARLTPTQYRLTREAGTERPHSGVYNTYEGDGMYHCSVCNAPLFTSETKYHSGSGWPSFYTVLEGRTAEQPDHSGGQVRTEIICSHCGAHLGHVFEDGPDPTGLRYCVNSASLFFRADGAEADDDGESIE